ncbi:alanine racemase [Propionibacteriaceae bacterium Y2011]
MTSSALPITPAFDVEVQTPGLVVDLDRVAANVAAMAEISHAAGIGFVPHAKSHRSPELGRLQLTHGADGLCLAKLGEAEAFATELADVPELHVFIAYPLVGTDKARRAMALARRVELTVGTDSVAGAASIGEVFAGSGMRCRMFLAIDSGLHREGVAPADAPRVAAEIAALPGVHLDGIYTHEGSVMQADGPDDLIDRSVAVGELMARTAEQIRSAGVPITDVSPGCSGSASHLADVPGLTQLRPGINTFGDLGQLALGNTDLDRIAVRVLVTVVSHPEPGRACIDAGTKSIGADLLPAKAYADQYPGYGLLVNAPGWQVSKLSEEHGWLSWAGEGPPPPLPVGTRLELVPNHVCVAFGSLRRWTGVRNGRRVGQHDCLAPGSSE